MQLGQRTFFRLCFVILHRLRLNLFSIVTALALFGRNIATLAAHSQKALHIFGRHFLVSLVDFLSHFEIPLFHFLNVL